MPYVEDGMEAIIFTAEGDMRQALNNLQATHAGFNMVSHDNVFKVRPPSTLRSASMQPTGPGSEHVWWLCCQCPPSCSGMALAALCT